MKAYIITSGGIFGLITIAHLARIIVETRHLMTEPIFFVLTLAAAGLFGWAMFLLRRLA